MARTLPLASKILERNPHIDRERLKKSLDIQKQLKARGYEKPSFGLATSTDFKLRKQLDLRIRKEDR